MTSYLFFVIITIRIEIIVVGGNMEQQIISKTKEQCVFLMKETNLDFYFIIPNSKQVSIVLCIFPDVNENVIKTLPTEQDKAIVIPIISNQILTSANHLDTTSFKYLDNVLSYLINVSYKILTRNNLIVDKKILLNNHSLYENFNNQYIEKYKDRVELYNLISKPKSNINQNIFEPIPEQLFKPVEPPFKNIPTTTTNSDVIEELVDPILSDEPVVTSSEKKENHEPGFVSYILLGVLVAVISLVFLYMIL